MGDWSVFNICDYDESGLFLFNSFYLYSETAFSRFESDDLFLVDSLVASVGLPKKNLSIYCASRVLCVNSNFVDDMP